MKQHITVEQLQEIEVDKLFKFLNLSTESCFYDLFITDDGTKGSKLSICGTYFKIGKMIEILEEHFKAKMEIKIDFDSKYIFTFIERIEKKFFKKIVHKYKSNTDILVDALWECIKEIIKEG